MVDKKVAGEEVTAAEPAPARAQVIDLMQALKDSLARKGARAEEGSPATAARELRGKRRPAAAARRREAESPRRRSQKR
jgi:non-homologous end joining protein Ku